MYLALAIVALAVVALVVFLAWRASRARVAAYDAQFIPLPGTAGWHTDTREIDERDMLQAITLAVQCLAAHTHWTAGQIRAYLTTWRVWVQSTPSFHLPPYYPGLIAGVALFNLRTIAVGSDLAALAHEIAEVCRTEIDHVENNEHARWQELGINVAIDAYQNARALQQSA